MLDRRGRPISWRFLAAGCAISLIVYTITFFLFPTMPLQYRVFTAVFCTPFLGLAISSLIGWSRAYRRRTGF
jgi:hypothetical protein